MNGKSLMAAIGNVSDRYIMEFAQVEPCKKKNRFWLKYAPIAASFVLIVLTVFKFSMFLHKDTIRPINMVTISGKMYEIIPVDKDGEILGVSYSQALEKRGLSYPINASSIGESWGVFPTENGDKYAVYDYKPYKGTSILIVQKDKLLQYALFCNLDNSNTIVMNDLLSIYGFDSKGIITSINVNGKNISDSASVDAIYEELKKASISESFVNTDNTKLIEITVKGEDSDVLIFNYYPDKGVMSRALTFYQVSPTLSSMLDESK